MAKTPSRTKSRHDEAAATATLRSEASRSALQLTVAYAGQTFAMELRCGRVVVLSGQWEHALRRDGTAVSPVSAWEATCWVSDGDVDYLELSSKLADGLCLERHVLLAKRDRFLLLADAILGDRPGPLQYDARLPLAADVSFQPARETHEGFLVHRDRLLALVLPLALPEWREAEAGGGLGTAPGALHWQQRIAGRRLFCPLLFNLDRTRMKQPRTWRQLTVAESVRALPADVAVGYRVAIGRRQWLIYRSLAPRANRTLLAHNLSSEMLVGRFSRKGEVESLIEIE